MYLTHPHWSACPCLIPVPVRYTVSHSHILHGAHFSAPVRYRISKSYILQVLVSDPDPQKSNSSIALAPGSSIFQNCVVQACHSRPIRPGPPKIKFLDLSSTRELYLSKLYRSGLPLPARQTRGLKAEHNPCLFNIESLSASYCHTTTPSFYHITMLSYCHIHLGRHVIPERQGRAPEIEKKY